MPLLIKICGLSTPETLEAALDAGADMVGFVFVEKSPRNVSLATARKLAALVPSSARRVALLVDASDRFIAAVAEALRPGLLQLHGSETPERVGEIRERFGIAVMKAIGVSASGDLAAVAAYRTVADHILIDAKPPRDAAYPGGHGRPFDWSILETGDPALDPGFPFMLSGGLDPANVAEAVRRTCAAGVDVSSGVESAPGVKDKGKISAFIRAARAAERRPA